MKILVVEDNALVALMIKDILNHGGFDVAGPEMCCEKAIDTVSRGGCACALVDIELSDGRTGGLLAQDLHLKFDVPVIFMTGERELALPYRDHALGLMTKPVSPFVILSSVVAFERWREGSLPDWPPGLELFDRPSG